MTVKEGLQNALKLFGPDGENWLNSCPTGSDGKYCAVTACSTADEDNRTVLWGTFDHLLPNTKPCTLLQHYNDSHTWPEVKALFEKAIAAAE